MFFGDRTQAPERRTRVEVRGSERCGPAWPSPMIRAVARDRRLSIRNQRSCVKVRHWPLRRIVYNTSSARRIAQYSQKQGVAILFLSILGNISDFYSLENFISKVQMFVSRFIDQRRLFGSSIRLTTPNLRPCYRCNWRRYQDLI